MNNKIKILLWNIPVVGIIYLFICAIKNDKWIENTPKNYKMIFSGLLIQLFSIITIPLIIRILK